MRCGDARSAILAQAEAIGKGGRRVGVPRWPSWTMRCSAHTMLSFAEMLGRLAVNDPETYPRERLEEFAVAAMGLARRR